jgi:hypothetical protein
MANPLLAPIELPARIATRGYEMATEALDVGRQLVRVASDGVTLLERLDRRAERFIDVAESIDAKAAAVLELGERIEASARAMVDLGGKIDLRGAEMTDLGRDIVAQANLVQERAGEVVVQAGELVRVIPTMERAVRLVEPLEGTVDVLGRVADRLTGSRTRGGQPTPIEGPDAVPDGA